MTAVPRVTDGERAAIAGELAKHPEKSLAEIARGFGRSITLVWQIYRKELGAGRLKPRLTGHQLHVTRQRH